jgi:hypothetical protein
MMVATTAGKKMPATHCVKPAPRPAVDDPSLASWTLPVTTAATKNARAGAGKSRYTLPRRTQSAAAIVPTMMKNPSRPPGSWPATRVTMTPTAVPAMSRSEAVHVGILPSQRAGPPDR